MKLNAQSGPRSRDHADVKVGAIAGYVAHDWRQWPLLAGVEEKCEQLFGMDIVNDGKVVVNVWPPLLTLAALGLRPCALYSRRGGPARELPRSSERKCDSCDARMPEPGVCQSGGIILVPKGEIRQTDVRRIEGEKIPRLHGCGPY
ncbi:MAG: hypothetical protein V3R87_05890 [Dehalococcoidia bacterium]